MKDTYFTLDKLSVGYNGKAIIRDIEIGITKGEIITLIGPNGSGKSTILKSITRQLQTIGGKVIFDGKDLRKYSYRQLSSKMAVVLTERMRPELMTCHDIVATGRYPYTGRLGILTEEDERIVEESLAAVHASDIGPKDFNAISDGQRQRILLARAICQEPELIVLDEPTSFLDVRHKLEFLSILRKMVREQNVAVIMSLHELDLAQKISDRIICVNGPTIEKYGTPEEIFTSDYIKHLYGISTGAYNPLFGCMELPAPQGKPEIFVIGGGGSGIPVYRELQRANIPFATGVLQENDIDYAAATMLATKVISVPAFTPVNDASIQEAKACIRGCKKIIAACTQYSHDNIKNKELL